MSFVKFGAANSEESEEMYRGHPHYSETSVVKAIAALSFSPKRSALSVASSLGGFCSIPVMDMQPE